MGPLDPSRLGAFLMRQIPPSDGEVVERGNVLPLGTYRTPDGRETTTLAFPQPMREGLDALAYALGYRQDPNAPAGYVTHDALNKGGQGLAESAMVGSLGARAPAGALRSGFPRHLIDREVARGLSGEDILQKARSGEYSPRISDIVRSANELELLSYASNARARFNNAVQASGGRPPIESRDIGGGTYIERSADEMNVTGPYGSVKGVIGNDPQIKTTYVGTDARGTGKGAEMYRLWAQEAGKPFRSDESVSEMAAVLYDEMFPRYGFNVLKNPDAELGVSGQWTAPTAPSGKQHVYRVEPPGMKHSTEFYANPMAGAVPLAFPAPQEDRNQALARFLASGGA